LVPVELTDPDPVTEDDPVITSVGTPVAVTLAALDAPTGAPFSVTGTAAEGCSTAPDSVQVESSWAKDDELNVDAVKTGAACAAGAARMSPDPARAKVATAVAARAVRVRMRNLSC
jgi:hypothetical protein